ncbi:MAG: EamA family transporter [Nannocystaceae bacterium]|nr:EamA family transporter [Nannocystaceae bacterium]
MSGVVQLLLASVLWSLSFGLIKGHLGDVHPAFVGFARLAFTLPVFLPFLRLRGLAASELRRLLFIGGVQYGLAYSSYLYAYQYLEGHHVALLTIFTPLYVVGFDALRARRPPWMPLAFAGLAVVGAAAIQYRGVSWSGVLIGVLLMQVANACFAWGQLAYRDFRHQHASVQDRHVFGLLFVGGTLVSAVTTTALQGWSAAATLSTSQLGILLYLGIVATGLGFFVWNRGAVSTPPATLAVMNNLKIPLAIVAAVVMFGERTDIPRLLAGGTIMLAAALIAQRWSAASSNAAAKT